MKKLLTATLLSLGIVSTASAGEVTVDMYGMSYHFKKSEAYHNAPRGWNDGQYVYNPGIGIEYDWRKKGSDGFSPIIALGWFRDCADYDFYYGGVGVKYKNHIFNSDFIWGIKAIAGVANDEDWDVDDNGNAVGYGRETTFLPVANVFIGYQFKNKNSIKINIAYVPENNSIGGTSGTDLLFIWAGYSF